MHLEENDDRSAGASAARLAPAALHERAHSRSLFQTEIKFAHSIDFDRLGYLGDQNYLHFKDFDNRSILKLFDDN